MTREYKPYDPRKLKTISISARQHKAETSAFAQLPAPGASAAELLDSLPRFLGAERLRAIVEAIVASRRADRPVVLALGAHVVKVGCSPIVIDLIERGIASAVVFNGATAIHDVEIATTGETSEEVAETIRTGQFGMVRETAEVFGRALASAAADEGLGAALGRTLVAEKAPNLHLSILAAAQRKRIPLTVHVAIGTDTIHMLAPLDGAKLGATTMTDFRLVCSVVADLGAAPGADAGGVWMNVGSAVLLPEVFLKAVAVARNLGADLDRMSTANLDMLGHYRPRQNVVLRPVSAGRGHEVIGQHEILLPLLRQALIERLG